MQLHSASSYMLQGPRWPYLYVPQWVLAVGWGVSVLFAASPLPERLAPEHGILRAASKNPGVRSHKVTSSHFIDQSKSQTSPEPSWSLASRSRSWANHWQGDKSTLRPTRASLGPGVEVTSLRHLGGLGEWWTWERNWGQRWGHR